MKIRFAQLLKCLVAQLCLAHVAQAGELVIESWRDDDTNLWRTVLLPAFHKSHPDIRVQYLPTEARKYDLTMEQKLARREAGDLITCRPFHASEAWQRKSYLLALNDQPGMENFSPESMLAWQTEDGKTQYCMPIASVIQGWAYNKKILSELKIDLPTTQQAWLQAFEQIKKSKRYTPLALGTADQWESAQLVLSSVGPAFWQGEKGRIAYLNGNRPLNDQAMQSSFQFLQKLSAYLPTNAQELGYQQSRELFANGKAAFFPLGSWDIAHFNRYPELELGVIPTPPTKTNGGCRIVDSLDIGMGINAHSTNQRDALRFLEWVGSQEFADLYSHHATGFISLSHHLFPIRDPLVKQMVDWRSRCESTLRITAQGPRHLQSEWEQHLWKLSAAVLSGTKPSRQAVQELHSVFTIDKSSAKTGPK